MIRVTITIKGRLEWILVGLVLAYRWVRYGYAFRRIPLTQGKYAIVDPEDYEELARYKWHCQGMGGTYYAFGNVRNGQRRVAIHRWIVGARRGEVVDHIDGDGLNNRRANLRICSVAENTRNRRARQGVSSRYKGVTYYEKQGKWQARICAGGKRHYLGWFGDEEEAARAYDAAARRLHGEFASVNFRGGARRAARGQRLARDAKKKD